MSLISSGFVSFAKRIQKKEESRIGLPVPVVNESINILFDKIKCISLNPLLSQTEKRKQVIELRKKILLREFVNYSEESHPKSRII